jgi:hypothetical protein
MALTALRALHRILNTQEVACSGAACVLQLTSAHSCVPLARRAENQADRGGGKCGSLRAARPNALQRTGSCAPPQRTTREALMGERKKTETKAGMCCAPVPVVGGLGDADVRARRHRSQTAKVLMNVATVTESSLVAWLAWPWGGFFGFRIVPASGCFGCTRAQSGATLPDCGNIVMPNSWHEHSKGRASS